MIFLTVGTQEPFDRLVEAVDRWAAERRIEVFGQLGRLEAGSYRPQHFPFELFVPAERYEALVSSCRLMVAHAGMGSIISALTWGKPILVLPRKAALGEHRNEHQLATADKFRGRAGIHVADEADEVGPLLDRLLAGGGGAGAGLSPDAAPELIAAVRAFVFGR
ncbi:glycosyltransferase [Thermaurantiacus sp.]